MLPASVTVINLARRPDRLRAFQSRWHRFGLDITPDVLTATDQCEHDPPEASWEMLPLGAWGCWDSHIRALNAARPPALILEDDAVFLPHFALVLADLTLPPDWEVAHLGGQHLYRPEPVLPGLVRPKRLYRSHAYLARYPQTLAVRLRSVKTHVDHALGQLGLSRYCVDPWLVGQDASRSDITRTSADTVEFWQERGVRRGA